MPRAKGKEPYLPFYGRDFYDDENVMVMDLAQQGAYLKLLWKCWSEGSIPADPEKLAAMTGTARKAFEASIWPKLERCFHALISHPDRLTNGRIERLRAERESFIGACSEAGKRGAEAKWRRHRVPDGDPTPPPKGTPPKPQWGNDGDNVPLHLHLQNKPTPTPPVDPDGEALAGEFERWIAGYPNAVKIDSASRAWLSLIGTGEITRETLPEVFAGLERWKASAEWAREDGRFIPAPVAFLTGNEKHFGRMWKDNPPASAEAKAARTATKRSSAGVDPNAIWVAPWKVDGAA
jgi:uncharacterized protein YdaU (DUF1376 family)